MKKKKLFVALAILLGVLVGARYRMLNLQYQNPKEYIKKMNEEVELGNYLFELKDWKWGDGNIINDVLPDYALLTYPDGKIYPKEKEKIALATVRVCKKKKDDTYLDLTNIAFEMGAWHNQWDNELFEALNGKNSLILKLEPGEEKEIIFPIVMFDFQFSETQWKSIEDKGVKIVLSCYPQKYVLLGEKNNK